MILEDSSLDIPQTKKSKDINSVEHGGHICGEPLPIHLLEKCWLSMFLQLTQNEGVLHLAEKQHCHPAVAVVPAVLDNCYQ